MSSYLGIKLCNQVRMVKLRVGFLVFKYYRSCFFFVLTIPYPNLSQAQKTEMRTLRQNLVLTCVDPAVRRSSACCELGSPEVFVFSSVLGLTAVLPCRSSSQRLICYSVDEALASIASGRSALRALVAKPVLAWSAQCLCFARNWLYGLWSSHLLLSSIIINYDILNKLFLFVASSGGP